MGTWKITNRVKIELRDLPKSNHIVMFALPPTVPTATLPAQPPTSSPISRLQGRTPYLMFQRSPAENVFVPLATWLRLARLDPSIGLFLDFRPLGFRVRPGLVHIQNDPRMLKIEQGPHGSSLNGRNRGLFGLVDRWESIGYAGQEGNSDAYSVSPVSPLPQYYPTQDEGLDREAVKHGSG